MALRVLVARVVDAGEVVAVGGCEHSWLARVRPGRDLVADHVVRQAHLQAELRVGVPRGHGRVGPFGAARLVDAPRAAQHQRREGLARVADQLEVRAEVGDVHLGEQLIAAAAARKRLFSSGTYSSLRCRFTLPA